jgi:hypothetical protein
MLFACAFRERCCQEGRGLIKTYWLLRKVPRLVDANHVRKDSAKDEAVRQQASGE